MLDMRWKALDRAVNLSQVPAQGDAAFQAFFCCAILEVRTLGQTFPKTSLTSIDAVASEILTRLLEYIDCDTHQKGHPGTRPLNYPMFKSSTSSELVCSGLDTFSSSYLLLVASVGPEAL